MSESGQNLTNWHYWQCSPDVEPAAFGPYAGLVALWRSRLQGGDILPPRSAFDFIDFRGWWGRVAIARIERDPFDVRFSLWGTQLTDWWGVDYTNRRLGEAAKNPELWSGTEGHYFARMAREPFIGIACGQLDQHDRSFKKVIGLDLPMGEGRTLTHVMAVHMEIALGTTPSDVMPDCPLVPVELSIAAFGDEG